MDSQLPPQSNHQPQQRWTSRSVCMDFDNHTVLKSGGMVAPQTVQIYDRIELGDGRSME